MIDKSWFAEPMYPLLNMTEALREQLRNELAEQLKPRAVELLAAMYNNEANAAALSRVDMEDPEKRQWLHGREQAFRQMAQDLSNVAEGVNSDVSEENESDG